MSWPLADRVRALGWRVLYWGVGQRLTVAVTAGVLRLVAALSGERRAEGLVSAFERRFVTSGWPHHRRGWVNLHASKFVARVRRFQRRPGAVAIGRGAGAVPLRLGCVGRFRGTLSFTKALFAAVPAKVELHLFDLEYNGACARYLADAGADYVPITEAAGGIEAAARAINAARLDVLVNVNSKPDAYDLLDRVDTPCVLNFCGGSDLLHHERVAFHLHGQPQADYFVVGRRMFCGTTGAYFESSPVYPLSGYYDSRDIPIEAPLPWSGRKPLMVFHGSLYKLAHDDVLDCLCGLMADDRSLEFVVMGKDAVGALDRIQRAAARHGVAARVHYEGVFDSSRGAAGDVPDAGWQRLRRWLAEARLAPDPWPVGGGSSRFEAFASGVPSVHMGVRFDRGFWGRPQPGLVEVPHMMIEEATAWSVAGYRAICERCLRDEVFARRLVERQLAVARELSDPARLWRQILAACTEAVGSMGQHAPHPSPVARTSRVES